MTTRRQMIAAAAWAVPGLLKADTSRSPRMGGAPTAFSNRMRAARGEKRPFDMIEYCHSLGLGGAETSAPPATPEDIRKFRARVEEYGMAVYCNIPLPKKADDVEGFDTAVRSAKEAGAIGLHAAMTQRRYEQFDSLEAFKNNFAFCQQQVAWAEPVLSKHKVRLAIENHKGWRAAEQVAWLKRLSTEYVGVCFDFGNNIALCEHPAETFRLLAPHTIFCHIKDMGVEPYEDGFLLSEVPFGEGILDLAGMVKKLRERDPNMLFCLEMITRDPLKVPIFTGKYWATFDDPFSPISGHDVARIVKLVRDNPPKSPLPRISSMSPAEQVKAEEDYNAKCIAYAHAHLDL